jgi:hypothetical protein
MGRSNLLNTHGIWRQFIEQHCKGTRAITIAVHIMLINCLPDAIILRTHIAYPHGYYSLSQFQKTLAQIALSDTLFTSSPPRPDQEIIPITSSNLDTQHEALSSISNKGSINDMITLDELNNLDYDMDLTDIASTNDIDTNIDADADADTDADTVKTPTPAAVVNPLFLSLLQQMNQHASTNK